MEVVTERLVLRPWARTDFDDMHVYSSDPAVCFFTEWGPNTPEQTEKFLIEAVASGAPLNVAIALSQDLVGATGTVPAGTVVGGLSAYGANREPVSLRPDSRELGWVVRRDLWGQRINEETFYTLQAWMKDAEGGGEVSGDDTQGDDTGDEVDPDDTQGDEDEESQAPKKQ